MQRFPRGFVLTREPCELPEGYSPGPLFEGLRVHEGSLVDSASSPEGFKVVVIGPCVSASREDPSFSPAGWLLAAARDGGEDSLLRATESLCGRFVVVYDVGAGVRLVQDATAMRSVFYSEDCSVIAGHARLVAAAQGAVAPLLDMPFQYGYPGNLTPFPGVRLLTANTLLDVSRAQVHRRWPTGPVAPRGVDSATEIVGEATVTALRNAARGRRVFLSLTAGLDSRATLAILLHSGIPFSTFTLGNAEKTRIDREVAAGLARIAHVPHTEIPVGPAEQRPARLPGPLGEALWEVHYAPHHPHSVGPLIEHVRDPQALVLTGNLLEIGRTFYHRARRVGLTRPVVPGAMQELHHFAFSAERKEAVAEWGLEKFQEVSRRAFASFIATTRFPGIDPSALDPFDQFYWEHRMSAWHGTLLNERDFYGESFIPFNARVVFEAMLGLPWAERKSGSVLYRLVEELAPQLLDLPVNPTAPLTHY